MMGRDTGRRWRVAEGPRPHRPHGADGAQSGRGEVRLEARVRETGRCVSASDGGASLQSGLYVAKRTDRWSTRWEPWEGSLCPSAPHLPPPHARFPLRGLRDLHLPHHSRSLRLAPSRSASPYPPATLRCQPSRQAPHASGAVNLHRIHGGTLGALGEVHRTFCTCTPTVPAPSAFYLAPRLDRTAGMVASSRRRSSPSDQRSTYS